MATRDLFSDDEFERLRGFGEINRAELIRYFTLAPADEMFVRKFRGQSNVLGAAVQLYTLPWLGFVPDEVSAAPVAAVARLSDRLGIAVGELDGYAVRDQTRTDHLREIARYTQWRGAARAAKSCHEAANPRHGEAKPISTPSPATTQVSERPDWLPERPTRTTPPKSLTKPWT